MSRFSSTPSNPMIDGGAIDLEFATQTRDQLVAAQFFPANHIGAGATWTIRGSNVDARSPGTSSSTAPVVSVSTVFVRVPLRILPVPASGGSFFDNRGVRSSRRSRYLILP